MLFDKPLTVADDRQLINHLSTMLGSKYRNLFKLTAAESKHRLQNLWIDIHIPSGYVGITSTFTLMQLPNGKVLVKGKDIRRFNRFIKSNIDIIEEMLKRGDRVYVN